MEQKWGKRWGSVVDLKGTGGASGAEGLEEFLDIIPVVIYSVTGN